jgi:hypothetical protein
MKLRLILRDSIEDADGRCVRYDYHTVLVEVPYEIKMRKDYKPEVIGGEWITEDKNEETL